MLVDLNLLVGGVGEGVLGERKQEGNSKRAVRYTEDDGSEVVEESNIGQV